MSHYGSYPEISLEGFLAKILHELSLQSYLMFKNLLSVYPDVNYISVKKESDLKTRKRLNRESGRITQKLFQELNTRGLFNFILRFHDLIYSDLSVKLRKKWD